VGIPEYEAGILITRTLYEVARSERENVAYFDVILTVHRR